MTFETVYAELGKPPGECLSLGCNSQYNRLEFLVISHPFYGCMLLHQSWQDNQGPIPKVPCYLSRVVGAGGRHLPMRLVDSEKTVRYYQRAATNQLSFCSLSFRPRSWPPSSYLEMHIAHDLCQEEGEEGKGPLQKRIIKPKCYKVREIISFCPFLLEGPITTM